MWQQKYRGACISSLTLLKTEQHLIPTSLSSNTSDCTRWLTYDSANPSALQVTASPGAHRRGFFISAQLLLTCVVADLCGQSPVWSIYTSEEYSAYMKNISLTYLFASSTCRGMKLSASSTIWRWGVCSWLDATSLLLVKYSLVI